MNASRWRFGRSFKPFRRPWLWVGLWALGIAAVVVASLLPAPDLPDLRVSDKSEHFSAYALLAAIASGDFGAMADECANDFEKVVFKNRQHDHRRLQADSLFLHISKLIKNRISRYTSIKNLYIGFILILSYIIFCPIRPRIFICKIRTECLTISNSDNPQRLVINIFSVPKTN